MIKYKNWRENNMTDLQECRRKIDEIDNQMVELFEKRMRVCEEVDPYRKESAGSGERACQTGRDQEKSAR